MYKLNSCTNILLDIILMITLKIYITNTSLFFVKEVCVLFYFIFLFFYFFAGYDLK